MLAVVMFMTGNVRVSGVAVRMVNMWMLMALLVGRLVLGSMFA